MTYLKDLSCSELAAMMEKNLPLFGELKAVADDFDTYCRLCDLFRGCPRNVDYNVGYPGDYIWVDRERITYSEEAEIIDWFMDRIYEEDNFLPEQLIDDAKKMKEYLLVLSEGVAKDADEKYMDDAVGCFMNNLGERLLDLAKIIYNQFDDAWYLADCFLSCELLDDYYIDDDGHVCKEMHPVLIG